MVLVLISLDNIKFCTSTIILKKASSLFCTTFSLPQPPRIDSATLPKETRVFEDAQTICGILKMVSGIELPSLDTLEELEKILRAAHKWDMPGPISIIGRMRTSPGICAHPLRYYIIACTFGLEESAKTASALTHNIDIWVDSLTPALIQLESKYLLKLLDLRRGRRDGLVEIMEKIQLEKCTNCSNPHLRNNFPWETLKLKAHKAMEVRPSEESLLGIKATMPTVTCGYCSIVIPNWWLEIFQRFKMLSNTI